MKSQEILELCKKHTLWTWSATESVVPIPVERASGVYFWTPDGKRFLDFNSQLMCVNIGHSHPKVIAAMKEALDGLIYTYPGTATPARAKLGEYLASLMPGDLNKFFFTLGGAEANENAIRAARLFTGRQKIISRYRSYHGATNATMQLTGDPRRWPSEPGMPGVIRVLDPEPYNYSFGDTDEEKTTRNLQYLEEVIMYEGPQNIAAMFIETVTGTNGILAPPAGYLAGLRALLDKYGILLVADEVMSGFGRTGKWFAVDHWGVVPDMITMAKGLTSGYAPLGAVAMTPAIAHTFADRVFQGGLTFNGHPISLAAAIANLLVMKEEGLIEQAAARGKVMARLLRELGEAHPSVGDVRSIGLFGAVELVKDRATREPLAPFNSTSPEMDSLRRFLLDRGLFVYTHWNIVLVLPPLIISEAELQEGFSILDEGLRQIDAVSGKAASRKDTGTV
jgi:taurine--2-oxoglutarate transaminase